jgi:hypothetical protein
MYSGLKVPKCHHWVYALMKGSGCAGDFMFIQSPCQDAVICMAQQFRTGSNLQISYSPKRSASSNCTSPTGIGERGANYLTGKTAPALLQQLIVSRYVLALS